MAFFELNSDITIGNFRFSGVHEVVIKKSIHSLADTATIKLPSKASVIKSDRSIDERLITGEKFKDGDPVEIRLGYNGDLRTEFKGFVKRRNLDKPLEVECEGYSLQLKTVTLDEFVTKRNVGKLLEMAVEKIPGNIKVGVAGDAKIDIEGLRIASMNIAKVISSVADATDKTLTCFFIEPDVLWYGLPYTSLAKGTDPFKLGMVSYKLGYNTISNEDLKLRAEGAEQLEVTYAKMVAGEKKSYVSDVYKGKAYAELLNLVSEQSLRALANEKALRTGYTGYEGSIDTFLQPYAVPGFIANISSEDYKERDGKYLVEGTEVTFGVNGAKRRVYIGPKLGFQKNKQ